MDTVSFKRLLTDIATIARRKSELTDELQPITDQIIEGGTSPAFFDKSNKLQEEIVRLDQLRKQLVNVGIAAVVEFGSDPGGKT